METKEVLLTFLRGREYLFSLYHKLLGAEPTRELMEAARGQGCCEEELGDLLFAVVNAARFLDIDAEEALTRASQKFVRRFSTMESMADRPLDELSLQEMECLWHKVKQAE